MSPAELIGLALHASIFGTVLSLGLRSRPSEATWVLSRPKVLVTGLVSMFVVMLLVALAIGLAFELPPAVEVALLALALSPIPPLLPKKELGAGADRNRTIGLLVAASLLSILIIPTALALLSDVFAADAMLSPWAVARLVGATVLTPLGLGLLVSHFAKEQAERVADPLMKVSSVVLILGLLPILISAGPSMRSLIGGGTLAAFAAFVVAGLVAGHVLGGPHAEARTALALSTATRHPGVALAIAASVIPATGDAMPAILLYLLTGAVLSAVYLALRRRRATIAATTP